MNTLNVPNSRAIGTALLGDQLVTSFSSKSELALNLSTDGQYLTFMGYVSGIDNIDVSNSNTMQIVDPTNPVGVSYYRAVAQVDVNGNLHFTQTNAYSGNNGRAAILNNTNGADFFYTAGNAGNGANPQPDGIIIGAGAQIMTPLFQSEVSQRTGMPTPVASFNVTQLGDTQDKIGKDDNFRGLTIFNNVLYYTKGSGSNGVNTVYWVDPTLTTCNDNNGVGLPPAGGGLPLAPLAYDPSLLQTKGLDPNNMCVLNGLPTTLAKKATYFPFGIWFAELQHALRCRRRQWRQHLLQRPRTQRLLLRPQQAFRSGSSIPPRVSGTWLMCCRRDCSSEFPTPSPTIPRETIRRRDYPGRREPMDCATSPALMTAMAR